MTYKIIEQTDCYYLIHVKENRKVIWFDKKFNTKEFCLKYENKFNNEELNSA